MELFWFLLGLTTGLALLSWYYVQLSLRLQRLVKDLKPDILGWSLSSISQLARAVAASTESQRSLEQQRDTWKQIFQLAPVGFLQVDDENQLLWCNLKAAQLLGIDQSGATQPRLLLELVRSYELDQLIEHTRLANQPCEREWVFHPVSADQETLSRQQPRPLRGRGFPLLNGSIGVFLESRQEVLLAQQRDRWTSDVAHELKTPLTSIRLVAETLYPRLQPPMQTWVDRLLKETIRLSNLVQDLLDLNQLDANPMRSLKQNPVDLVSLLQTAWLNLEPLARRKFLQLGYQGPDSVIILADEPRLLRVLLNLLDNSIKYSPPHATIRVEISCPTPPAQSNSAPSNSHPGLLNRDRLYVQIEVIDQGPGFPEAALEYVFERFYRADPSRTRQEYVTDTSQGVGNVSNLDHPETLKMISSGSGLGLAIVRQIVEAHQGKVQARNHPETHGAWLQVWLPLPPA